MRPPHARAAVERFFSGPGAMCCL